ncbi:peptidylprolyl isomerase [Pontiella sp.]|uniref:peptidylprolyl isomerase n=1 Tax=Pontiella sp. TaxID=2837462 RepID=UPI00356303A7
MNKKTLLLMPVAALLVLSGCQEDEAASVPTPEPVDLSATEDLFAEPVKANPLTSDPNAVVVRVNGEDITRGEISQVMNMAMQQFAGRVQPQQMQQLQAQMYEQIKNDLISKKLIDAAVAKANVTVDEAKLTEVIEQIKSQPLPEGMTFDAALASQGMTLAELTENIRSEMATRQFLESKTEGVAAATEAEALEYYNANPDRFQTPEGVSASHILLGFDEGDTDETKAAKKAKLEKIRGDIIAGTISFEDAAMANSTCPSKEEGGSLGTFGKGRMVPEFEVAAFTQEIDEVGDIVETQFGYHIIKVTDRTEAGTVSFDEAKEQLLSGLSGQKKQEAVQAFIKSLRDSATIEEIAM